MKAQIYAARGKKAVWRTVYRILPDGLSRPGHRLGIAAQEEVGSAETRTDVVIPWVDRAKASCSLKTLDRFLVVASEAMDPRAHSPCESRVWIERQRPLEQR